MPGRDACLESYAKAVGLTLAIIANLMMLWGSGSAQTVFLDAVLATVDTIVITASDVALARALDLFGLQPSEAPILPAEIERFVHSRLVEREALRLDMQGTADQLEEAWRAASTRVGGEAALSAWLDRNGIDLAWARRMVEADLRWRRFIDTRFRSFAIVSEAEVTQAMGAGPHAPEDRRRMYEALQDAAVQRTLAAWIQEARTRAAIRFVNIGQGGIPVPFPMPPEIGPRPAYPSKP